MNGFSNLAYHLCASLLRLYPPQFQAQFGAEMRSVLQIAFEAASSGGYRKVFLFCLREITQLPASLLSEYRASLKQEELPMSLQSRFNSVLMTPESSTHPGSWLAAVLAGLPHLMMGLLIGFGKIIGSGEDPFSQTTNSVIAILLGLLVIVVLIFAWRGGWPVWSASWYLYGTWVTVVALGLVIASLPLRDSWRYSNLLFLGWIILCVTGYIALLLKSRLHGLLAVAFLFPFLGILMLEFIPDSVEGWLAVSLGLLAAVICGVIVKIGELRTAVLLVLIYNFFAGLALAYVNEYQMRDLPPGVPAHVPEISTFIITLGAYSLVVLGILAIPFILNGLWDFGRRKLSN